ncbi:MAG: hypothetical protein OXG35_03615 [Acidobacteria bacterium]|nr:hypothetical protein [Acidobacteriota bacterium]
MSCIAHSRSAPEPFAVGELSIDYEHRRVTVGGEPLELTVTEYELLRVLSLDAGRVVTFETRRWRTAGFRDGAPDRTGGVGSPVGVVISIVVLL